MLSNGLCRVGTRSFRKLYTILMRGPSCYGTTNVRLGSRRFLQKGIPVAGSRMHSIDVTRLRLARSTVICSVNTKANSISVRVTHTNRRVHICTVRGGPRKIGLVSRGQGGFEASKIQVVRKLTPRTLRRLRAPARTFINKDSKGLQRVIRLLREGGPSMQVIVGTVSLRAIDRIVKLISRKILPSTRVLRINTTESGILKECRVVVKRGPICVVSTNKEGPKRMWSREGKGGRAKRS